jgi:hypothetical protein
MLKPDRKTITYLLLFVSLPVLFFSSGGLLVTLLEDRVQFPTPTIAILGSVAGAALLVLVITGRRLLSGSTRAGDVGAARQQRKHVVFSLILFCALFTVTLVLMNLVASFFTVPWPMNGLHGVSSEVGRKAWEYQNKAEGYARVNSWGQRDREHTVLPRSGTYRVIFIGDSFLELGAAVPLTTRMDEIFTARGGASPELINLGVAATDPDEYFFRLKRIGLPLRPDHCVITFYAGNDLIQGPTLLSYGGISATYPRWSFLQLLGLTSLDHVISNERRQALRSWFKGGDLLKHELELQDIFGKTADDRDTEQTYLSFFPPGEQAQLKSVLHASPDAARRQFFDMLRHPDDGRFRSYYLDVATKVAKGMPAPEFVAAEYSFRWVKAAYDLCRKQGIRFTLVVIPDGFSVDPRMAGQYAALADMKSYMAYKDAATSRLVSHASEAGIDVVDLRNVLAGEPGTYLNMDGHWSQRGVDRVAAQLAEKLGSLRR